jgi:hypothetical protein
VVWLGAPGSFILFILALEWPAYGQGGHAGSRLGEPLADDVIATVSSWSAQRLLSLEPHPPDRGQGRSIFLNGASASGKSMLAKAVQEARPYLSYTFGPYDFEVATTNAVPSAVAASVLAA